MTSPSEIPEALKAKIEQLVAELDDIHFNGRPSTWVERPEELVTFALQVRNEAIAEEREACARFVECDGCDFCADGIPTAIRARP